MQGHTLVPYSAWENPADLPRGLRYTVAMLNTTRWHTWTNRSWPSFILRGRRTRNRRLEIADVTLDLLLYRCTAVKVLCIISCSSIVHSIKAVAVEIWNRRYTIKNTIHLFNSFILASTVFLQSWKWGPSNRLTTGLLKTSLMWHRVPTQKCF